MEKIGLIDLGSNTIKLAVYEVSVDGFKRIFYDASYAYIIQSIKDNILTLEGIDKIIEIINKYQAVAQDLGCDVLECFSTASLRHIENRSNVIETVRVATGITISPISGEEEAYYNFLSMTTVAGENFLGGDMGGGSMQLFLGEEKRLVKQHSFPLGALKVYEQFVAERFPTHVEADAITAYVTELLQKAGFHQNDGKDTLYFMGGSTRVTAALLHPESNSFSREELSKMLTDFLDNTALAEEKIRAVCPERLLTVMPGMIILNTLCDYFHVKKIVYTINSVREGYLIHRFTERNYTQP